jgi:hypothetical protein
MVKKKKLSAPSFGVPENGIAGCQLPVKRMAQVLLLLLAAGHWQLGTAWAQQAQAQQGQPLYAVNAKYVNGVAPGYWPTAGAGLTLNIAAGTAICGNLPVKVDYAGGTLTMTNAATNYVYLDPVASCVPAKNTTGFTAGVIPVAQVAAAGGVITGVTDVRTWFVDPNSLGPVIRADLMPGADAGAKIAACIAALPVTGGICDARGLQGVQTISQDVFAGAVGVGFLLLGEARFDTSVTQNVPTMWTVEGIYGDRRVAGGHSYTGLNAGTVFKWTGAINTSLMTVNNSSGTTLRNLTLWSNDVAGSIGLSSEGIPPEENNSLRLENINIYDFQDTGFVWGTGGAGGWDASLFVLDGFRIEGSTGNTLAKGIVINSTAAGFSQIKNGYVRTVNKGIQFLYAGGEVMVDNVLGADPTGGAPNGGASATTPNFIEVDRIDRAISLRNVYLEATLSTAHSDVRYRSLYVDTTNYLFGTIGIESSGLNYPTVIHGPARIVSINNFWAYGPAELTSSWASVISIGDSVSYNSSSFAVWQAAHVYTKSTVAVPLAAPNGHYYRVAIAGTSDASTEPVWPVTDGGTVVDGTVTWTEVGSHTSSVEPWISRDGASQVFTLGEVGTNTPRIWPINLTPSGSLLDLVLKNGLSIGTNPATTGNVRLSNNASFVARNAANNADLGLIKMDTSNRIDFYGGRFLMGTNDFSPNVAATRTLGAVARWSTTTVGKLDATYYLGAVNTVTFSATPTFDASLGNTQKITLTANVTSSTLSNATAGQTINFLICQDATGGRTFVWPTNVKGGMTIGATLSKCSAQDFIFDGTNAYAVSSGVTNM